MFLDSLLILWLLLTGMQRPDAPAVADVRPHYTVQIQSAPAARKNRVLQTYEDLKAKGHLVYCRSAYVGEQFYVRLRTGFFWDRDQARAHLEALRESEGFDGFVTQANLAVTSFGEDFDIVTTPNDLWFRSGTALRPLYHFDTDAVAATCSAVAICPAGRAIAFACDNKILRIDLQDDSVTVLKQGQDEDALFKSLLAWSPDGRHLAYLDRAGWELPSRLRIMRSDGSGDRCLAGDASGRTRVKSLQWHPRKEELFYVSGPTHGTVSVGGSLYRVDLHGRRKVIAPASATDRTEVHGDFHIADDEIHYRLAHFDRDYQAIEYTMHRAPLDP
ncbi:SPOR domain-containing protein [Anaerobaca lacustris]|uniref:SPOR domain-containing protein n=1 Tax=Anaerobaca lacustris TaxID=3044600 RepID=A0AAW6U262_9BACT|nr:SPOR domain-containing protein [Sedimentisphaerales bacterium M17dextr]